MKLTKLIGLLFVSFLLPSCNSNEDKVLPLITKIDLTDSKLVLWGNPCAEGEKSNEDLKLNDTSNSTLLYKVNNNNQIERIKINSENSDDDLAFTSDCDFTLYDVDENYFRIFVSTKKNKAMYLVSKKTGECRSISLYDFNFSNLHYNKSSSYRRYVNVDGQGNYFGMGDAKIEQYSSNWITDQLIKTKVGENFELDTARISKEEHPYSINNQFAVDKDGNAAYVATCYEKDHPACFHYITVDGKDFVIDTNEKIVNDGWTSEDSWTYDSSTKGFWQGYDGEIYTNEEGYICKLVPKKDSNGEVVSIDQVRVSDKTDIPNNFFSSEFKYVFFDDLQEIYLLDKGYCENNRPTSLYCIYGSNIGKKVYSGLDYALDGENGFLGDYLFASGDSIYFIKEKSPGGGDIVTRINVKNSFATSTIALGYYVSVDNKMTKDNKMFTVSKSNNLKQIDVYDFETKQVSRVFYDSSQIEYIGFLDDAIVI